MIIIMIMAFETITINNYSQSTLISPPSISPPILPIPPSISQSSIHVSDLIISSIDIMQQQQQQSSSSTILPTENFNQSTINIININDNDQQQQLQLEQQNEEEQQQEQQRNYSTYKELELLDKQWQIIIIFLYTLTAALALFGNILAICALLFGRRASKELRIFLVNLSMSDIMMALFSIPFTYTDFMLGRWIFAPAFCPIVQQMQMTCVFVSVYTLTAIGIDRYMAIIYPLYSQRYNHSFGPITISIIWLFGFLLGLFQWTNTKATPFLIANETNYDCKEISSDHSQFFTIIIFIITFALPMTILSFTYASIGVKIFRHSAPGNVDVVRDRNQHASKVKIMKMLVTIVILFVVCWLPLHILNLFIYFARDLMVNVYNSQLGFTIYVSIAFTAHWFSMANSFVNPIIYCFMSENFRADLRDLFAECLHRMTIICNPIDSQTDRDQHNHHHHRHRRRHGGGGVVSHFVSANNESRINHNNHNDNNHCHANIVPNNDDEQSELKNEHFILESNTTNVSNDCHLQLIELIQQPNTFETFNDNDNNGGDDGNHCNTVVGKYKTRLLLHNDPVDSTITCNKYLTKKSTTTIVIDNDQDNPITTTKIINKAIISNAATLHSAFIPENEKFEKQHQQQQQKQRRFLSWWLMMMMIVNRRHHQRNHHRILQPTIPPSSSSLKNGIKHSMKMDQATTKDSIRFSHHQRQQQDHPLIHHHHCNDQCQNENETTTKTIKAEKTDKIC
ncbi:uncharacterized protein LOC113796972 [Dermatophagoides pteronyssinus]|uniref:uncharacterized protein LOC113796972 n=1 Tax=Dermatophagoides pteronyssinus TaxID=6956 RepID=UPI003F665098